MRVAVEDEQILSAVVVDLAHARGNSAGLRLVGFAAELDALDEDALAVVLVHAASARRGDEHVQQPVGVPVAHDRSAGQLAEAHGDRLGRSEDAGPRRAKIEQAALLEWHEHIASGVAVEVRRQGRAGLAELRGGVGGNGQRGRDVLAVALWRQQRRAGRRTEHQGSLSGEG